MDNSEQIKDVFEKLEALKNNIDDKQKKIAFNKQWICLKLLKNLKPMNRSKNTNITVRNQSPALTLTDLGKLG